MKISELIRLVNELNNLKIMLDKGIELRYTNCIKYGVVESSTRYYKLLKILIKTGIMTYDSDNKVVIDKDKLNKLINSYKSVSNSH
jgi:hypothetical protein